MGTPTEGSGGDWENELKSTYTCIVNDQSEVTPDSNDDDTSACESKPESDMTYTDVLCLVRKLKTFAFNKDERYLDLSDELEIMTERNMVKQKCAKPQLTLHVVRN